MDSMDKPDMGEDLKDAYARGWAAGRAAEREDVLRWFDRNAACWDETNPRELFARGEHRATLESELVGTVTLEQIFAAGLSTGFAMVRATVRGAIDATQREALRKVRQLANGDAS